MQAFEDISEIFIKIFEDLQSLKVKIFASLKKVFGGFLKIFAISLSRWKN